MNNTKKLLIAMDQNMLDRISWAIPKEQFSTRSEFIRDCVRRRLRDIEVQDALITTSAPQVHEAVIVE